MSRSVSAPSTSCTNRVPARGRSPFNNPWVALVTGTYDRRTGNLNLTFTQPVAANGMTWTGTQSVYAPAPLLVTDLDPAAFPTSGRLPVLAPGRVVVVPVWRQGQRGMHRIHRQTCEEKTEQTRNEQHGRNPR